MEKRFESRRTITLRGSITFIIKKDQDGDTVEVSMQANEFQVTDDTEEKETEDK